MKIQSVVRPSASPSLGWAFAPNAGVVVSLKSLAESNARDRAGYAENVSASVRKQCYEKAIESKID